MLDARTIDVAKKILSTHLDLGKYKVFIFGSQATGISRNSSDLDIGIEGPSALDLSILGKIEEDFEESDITQTIDIVDFSKVSEKFKSIAKEHVYYLN